MVDFSNSSMAVYICIHSVSADNSERLNFMLIFVTKKQKKGGGGSNFNNCLFRFVYPSCLSITY